MKTANMLLQVLLSGETFAGTSVTVRIRTHQFLSLRVHPVHFSLMSEQTTRVREAR